MLQLIVFHFYGRAIFLLVETGDAGAGDNEGSGAENCEQDDYAGAKGHFGTKEGGGDGSRGRVCGAVVRSGSVWYVVRRLQSGSSTSVGGRKARMLNNVKDEVGEVEECQFRECERLDNVGVLQL